MNDELCVCGMRVVCCESCRCNVICYYYFDCVKLCCAVFHRNWEEVDDNYSNKYLLLLFIIISIHANR